MKYPTQQFEILVSTLTELSKHFELKQVNPSSLYFLAYQQHAEGQEHNRICLTESGTPIRAGYTNGQFQPIVTANSDFQLYPEGCNDSHVKTAVKQALKIIYKE